LLSTLRAIAIRRVCLFVGAFVRSLTSCQWLRWLAGGLRVGGAVGGRTAGDQHRSGVAGAWRKFAPFSSFLYCAISTLGLGLLHDVSFFYNTT